MKEKLINQNELSEDNESQILSSWLEELSNNENFKEETLIKKPNLKEYSKSFLAQLFQTINTEPLPAINTQELKPILSVWHQLLHDQLKQGFTAKETAMLIYSLKTSIQKMNELPLNENQVESLSQLLDFLGILTFEIYTIEKEKLISRQVEQIDYLQKHALSATNHFFCSSPAMNSVYKAIGLVLENDISVLIEGETGSGKDVIASLIHQNSKRQHKPFVPLNCAAIPKELIESELFGHEKGAFTGADNLKLGKFELAHQGTLFLDEIGDLPLDMQAKLLRALQNKEIERVGGSKPVSVNTRIISATNQNLKQKVDKGTFRLDLYYRLHIYPITMPPLRKRVEDIIPLANHFLKKYASQFSLKPAILTKEAETYLKTQYWEGNIRELENLMQRALVLSQGQPITSHILESKPGQDLTPQLKTSNQSKLLTSPVTHIIKLEEVEKEAILNALKLTNNNIKKASSQLGVSRTTLYNKLEKYGIDSN